MKNEFKSLLDNITKRYNAEVQQRYVHGEYDFIPKDRTADEMLEAIIALYALENYPDLLDPEGGMAK